MTNRAEPAALVLVTGHAFGLRAFEGIFSSPAYLDGRLTVPLMIGLGDARAAATVGYQSPAALAAEQGVPYVATTDGRLTSLADEIRAARPAYLLVIGWSRLIPDEILAIPGELAPAGGGPGASGCIGMHPTRLPHGRGQAPIPWTIIKGVKRTALSVFLLAAGADTGPVVAQYELDVHDRETGASLFYRIAQAHFTAGQELAGPLARRQVSGQPQDEAAASRWPRRRPADGELTAALTTAEADALVRALLGPYPRAFAQVGDDIIYVRGIAPAPAQPPPGAADRPGRVWFRCRDGAVWLIRDDGYRAG
jgi:methionyl-tRNA formyltransferase